MESHGRAESPRQFHARRMIAGQLIKTQCTEEERIRCIHPAYILAVGTGFGRIPQYEYARPAATTWVYAGVFSD
jgi:hypothetical protein